MTTIKHILQHLYTKKQSDFFACVKQSLSTGKRMFIITANPEIVMKASEDEEICSMLLDKQVDIVADGIGIVKAYEMLGLGKIERIPGVEIVEQLFTYANALHKSVCILGSQQEVLDALQKMLFTKYPNLVLVSAVNGYVENKQAVMEGFAQLKPDIVLVALGVPTQEKLIYQALEKFDQGIFVGIGGSLDVLSGTKKRAPKFFVKLNLEWLYRIGKEPKRIRRFYENNVKFIAKIRKER